MVSLQAFEQYHADLGRVWERQMLIKARPCAGEARTGELALEMISDLLARAPAPDVQALHGMRLRMERERGSQGAEAGIHLKLGPGGMADIEFWASICQLMRWAEDPRVRTTRTVKVIQWMRDSGAISEKEGE